MSEHPDPFGYEARRAEIESEDAEAAELLAGMTSNEPEQFIRGLLVGNRGDDLLAEMLIPPDGPYPEEDLTRIFDEGEINGH